MKKLYKTEDIKKLKIDDVRQLYKKYVSPSQTSALGVFGFGKDIIENAKGNWLYTQNKVKILDFTGGYGVLNHGHNHPKIIKARINFQNENRMEIHKNYLSQYTAALSANIANLLPEDLNKVYLPNSGAEANEGAIKIAYKYFNGKKKYLLHSDISFHGKLLGTGSISGSPESNFKFPGLTDTDKFEYGNIKSVKEKIFSENGSSKDDTGSAEGQIALFTHRINHLSSHLKKNPKDFNTERSLVKIVGKRKSLLDYLKNKDIDRYRSIIKKLEIRK